MSRDITDCPILLLIQVVNTLKNLVSGMKK